MGKPSRNKGLRRERAIVELHVKCGIPAERVPLSGASRYRGNGADIDIYARGATEPPLTAEVKARGDGNGFKTLLRWLGSHDALFLWQDRQAPIVVIPMHVWLEVLGLINRTAGGTGSIQQEPDADTARQQARAAAEHGRPHDAIAERAA
jgi:hypothetical protein